jgi:hypothetical protein
VVLTNVAITDLEGLRDKARALIREFAMEQPDHWVEVRSEGIAFCFENATVAVLFCRHCTVNGVDFLQVSYREWLDYLCNNY